MAEVTFVGWGAVARATSRLLTASRPGTRIAVVSEHAGRAKSLQPDLLRIQPPGSTLAPGTLLVVTDSIAEAPLVSAWRRSHLGGEPVPREIVAAPNLRRLRGRIDPEPWRAHDVLVVTNPSEVVAEAVARWCASDRVWAFGMALDRDRLTQAHKALGLAGALTGVTGLHWLDALPLVVPPPSEDDLMRLMARSAELTRREFRPVPGDPTTLSPPVDRPARVLARLLQDWLEGRPVEVSGRPAGEVESGFVGGVLAADRRTLRVPVTDAVVAARLESDRRHHAEALGRLLDAL